MQRKELFLGCFRVCAYLSPQKTIIITKYSNRSTRSFVTDIITVNHEMKRKMNLINRMKLNWAIYSGDACISLLGLYSVPAVFDKVLLAGTPHIAARISFY